MVDIASKITEALGADVLEDVQEFAGETTYIIAPQRIVEVCTFLRDAPDLEFKQLSDIAGVDYYQQPAPGRFGINYHLLSLKLTKRIRLKVYWSEEDPPVPSVVPVWPSANWEEREAYDMFGIPFEGHPDLRRLLMPDDWQGFPQRKDYPLGYETVQFSFNYDEINKHKPYAKE
ncbi:MAG: NADH-quinone oxidoreductase subunit C [Anaerolineales bacterium]